MFFQMTGFKFNHFFWTDTRFFSGCFLKFNSVLFPQQDMSSWLKPESLEVSKTTTIGCFFWMSYSDLGYLDRSMSIGAGSERQPLSCYFWETCQAETIICFNLSKRDAEIGEVFFPWISWWGVPHSWLEVILYSKQLPYVKAPVEQNVGKHLRNL